MRALSLAFLTVLWTACFGSAAALAQAGAVDGSEPLAGFANRLEVGAGLRFMPIGWFDLADEARRTEFRAYPALGAMFFVDYRVNRFLSLGVSPELTLNVIPNRSDYHVGKLAAGEARFQVRYPNHTRFEPYAMLTGGYSVIWRKDADSASGPVLGGAVGGSASLSRKNALFLELAYQRGFQTIEGQAYGPRYLIIGAGWRGGRLAE